LSPDAILKPFPTSGGGKGLWGSFPVVTLDLDVPMGAADASSVSLELRAFKAIQDVLGDGYHGLAYQAVAMVGGVAKVRVRAGGWRGRASLIRYIRAVSRHTRFRRG
jgi:hypothetical protein